MPRKPDPLRVTIRNTQIEVEWWHHKVYASGIVEVSYLEPGAQRATVVLLNPDGGTVVSGTAPLEEEDEDE